MSSAGLQTPPGKACPTSRPAGWPAETTTEYPQASYYRARYYDPMSGRFTSEDPTGFKGGLNFYQYVTNDPANQTDPMGFDSDSQRCRMMREKKRTWKRA